MMKKIWRYTHLVVACIIFIYLIIASFTGAILGIHEVLQSKDSNQQESIASVIEKTQKQYAEIISIKRNNDDVLELQAYDDEYNEIKGVLDTQTGKISTIKKEKNAFIDWNTALHRSLFLEKNGRFLVGLLTFLFLIELITGLFYMVRIVPKKRHLLTKWKYANFALTYHHSVSRVVMIPLLILGITGVVLFLFRFDFLQQTPQKEEVFPAKSGKTTTVTHFDFLKNHTIDDLISLEFPFDDSEGYKIETIEGKYELDFHTGDIIWQQKNDTITQWKTLSFSLHTGKLNNIWALVISLSVLTIPGFVLTGFMLFAKKRKPKTKDFSSPQDAEIIVLYGSENGSTRQQAFQYALQIAQDGMSVFLGTLNEISSFPNAKKMLILSSTYGNGEAPSNASSFLNKIQNLELSNNLLIGIIGFGSKDYIEYNAFAEKIHQAISEKKWGKNIVFIEKIDDRNQEEIALAEEKIQCHFGLKLQALEMAKMPILLKYRKEKIISKSSISEKNHYCSIEISSEESDFVSGDLVRVVLPNSDAFRHYSISKKNNHIALFTKSLMGGQCSEYFKTLSVGDEVEIAIEKNAHFHLNTVPTILICNGTGIAPFIGMIENNVQKIPITLYAGFRYEEENLENLKTDFVLWQDKGHLQELHWSYSREENGARITALIERDILSIVRHLIDGNEVMICGALELKKEVEVLISNELNKQNSDFTVEDFYLKGCLKSDCY